MHALLVYHIMLFTGCKVRRLFITFKLFSSRVSAISSFIAVFLMCQLTRGGVNRCERTLQGRFVSERVEFLHVANVATELIKM